MAEGRIIKASAFTSDSVANMSDFQFRLWVGLITHADNVGRGDARPAILKGALFSLRDKVRAQDIEQGLVALANNGSIFLYEVAGKPFYAFPNWQAHQRLRKDTSKFPSPDDPAATRRNLPQLAATRRKARRSAAESGLARARVEEEVEVEVEVEEEEEGEVCSGGCGNTRAGAREEKSEEPQSDLARIMNFYFDKINATPSSTCIDLLKSYAESLGADVVIHACEIALDEKKISWSYIHSILQRYERAGLRTLDAILQEEAEYARRKQEAQPKKERRITTFMDV